VIWLAVTKNPTVPYGQDFLLRAADLIIRHRCENHTRYRRFERSARRAAKPACYTADVKSLLKALVPEPLLQKYRAYRLQRRYSGLRVQEVFAKIYATNAWGGSAGEFYSGLGSDDQITSKYIEFVSRFIVENRISSTLDLGCGDFRVGSRVPGPVIGVDVVPSLIERNRQSYPKTEFYVLDMIQDELPIADLCLVRQVFQHLSNAQILRVLPRLSHYHYVLVTEHQFLQTSRPNLDKLPGPDIRKDSGVFLELPPFSQTCETVLEVPLSDAEVLRTVLIRNQSGQASEP
jgi:hypothetical protein